MKPTQRVLLLVAAFCAATAHRGLSAQSTAPIAYDVVIRGGRVLDGAGNPWINADVTIRDGHFVTIGVVPGRGRVELDARGKYVSPGWIHVMDQSGSVFLTNPLAQNKLMMGMTSAIAGEGGTPVDASDIPQYFDSLQHQGISINFGSYFSETQARTEVLGNTARAPNAAELVRMRAIMDTAMCAGAMGMTKALIYPPSSFATTDELVEVAKAAAPYGGIYASHIRGEGKEVVQSVKEAISIGERAGMPVEIFHLKVAYKPGWGVLMDSVRQAIEAARARGVDVAADMYVYTAGGTGLKAVIPSWAQEGGSDSLGARLKNPEIRERLKREQQTGSPGWWNILEDAVRKMTSWPATRYRLANRGVIKEGDWADVAVFDLASLDDRATYEHPTESPTGIEWVRVNGIVTIDHGKHTGAKAGKVLYGPGHVVPGVTQ